MSAFLGKKMIASVASAASILVAIGGIWAFDDRIDNKITAQTNMFAKKIIVAEAIEDTQKALEAQRDWAVQQQRNAVKRQLRVINRKKNEGRATPEDLDLEYELLQELEDLKPPLREESPTE